MNFKFDNNTPIYIQLVEQIKIHIVSGCLLAGERLPSVRDLAMLTKVNPNTMQRALSLLEEEGLLISRGTVGRYVTSELELIESAKKKICFDTVKRFCLEAQALGISQEELIDYIKEVAIHE